MRFSTFVLLGFLVLASRQPTEAAQLGDINGDGRVSPGDAFLLSLWQVTGLEIHEPARGSTDFEPEIRCTSSFNLPYLVFLEALRRESPGPLPHFIERWPEDPISQAPRPAEDDSVKLEVLDTHHSSGEKEVELRVRLSSAFPLHFLGLLVRVGGLDLRPRRPADLGDADGFIATSEHYVITGGAFLAYRSGFGVVRPPEPIEEGTVITLRGVLPRGTEPGSYRGRAPSGNEGRDDLRRGRAPGGRVGDARDRAGDHDGSRTRPAAPPVRRRRATRPRWFPGPHHGRGGASRR